MDPADLGVGQLFERVRDAVIISAPASGQVVLWNPAAAALFGYSAAEAVGLRLADLFPALPDPPPAAQERLPSPAPALHQARRRTGEPLTVELTVEPLRAPGGEHFWLLMARDVTPQRRLASERQQLLASARCLLWYGTVEERDGKLHWRLVVPDEAAAQRFLPLDVPEGETYASAWDASRSEDDRARMTELANGALRGGRARYSQLFRSRQQGGEVRWLWEDVRIERLEPGRWRLVGVCTDITEHRRAEEALGESEEFNRALLASLPQRIFFKDHDGVFRSVNASFAADLSVSPAEILGRTDYDFFPRALADKYRADDLRVMNRRVPELLEEANVIDGEERVVEVVKAPVLRHDGTVLGVLGVFSDITGRKQLEEQLRDAQKMEAVGRLAGGVAHEFNNLLMAITGFSELLLLKLGPDDVRRRYADEIRAAADRAATLTRQLLAFGRKQMLQPQVLDLNQVLGHLSPMLRRQLGEQVEFLLSPEKGLGRVEADPDQMEQVVVHLCVNAGDAMQGRGRVTVQTANVDLDEQFTRRNAGVQPGPYVLLSISDDGPGMDAETRSHLFEPFFSTKDVGEGAGLGLATVYGIVKQSGGHIRVSSVPGRGTSFEVYLPRIAAAAPAVPTDFLAAPAGSRETILVAEDEEIVRELIREVLERAGYRVLAAADGAAALALASGKPLQLLVADVVMPVLGGPELAERLVPDHPGLPALFMSAYSDAEIAGLNLVSSNAAFLRKPFSPETLVRKVRQMLDARPPAR